MPTVPSHSVTIARETPGSPGVAELVHLLDDYLLSLYPAESCYGLGLAALSASDVVLLVARLDGLAVGCGAVFLYSPDYAELKRIFVHPACRGRGVARSLLTALESAAAERGRAVVRLETGIHQPEAIALYERTGYTRCGPFGNHPDDPLSLFYEKELPAIP